MDTKKHGYTGKWVFIDLTKGSVEIRASDPAVEMDYLGGRGIGAYFLAERMRACGGPINPLGPENRIVIGGAPCHGARLHTAGRGSASFISPMTCSRKPLLKGLQPIHGLLTHSSIGGTFPNRMKKAGIDQIIIDGRSPSPVRIIIDGDSVRIVSASSGFFEASEGGWNVLTAVKMDTLLKTCGGPASASLYLGPAGWSQVPWACLTTDTDRNFGRGGGGAVFGAKNLIAITVSGETPLIWHDQALFQERIKVLEGEITAVVRDHTKEVHFRPTVGTTFWLDRAQHGGYLGQAGGYLPWHNYDEGSVPEQQFETAGTKAFLEISDIHKVCLGCREVLCSRLVKTREGKLLPRPEFETAALFINCGITRSEDLVRLNHLCNEVGADTMTTGAMVAAAMDLHEKGILQKLGMALPYGDFEAVVRAIKDIAYRRNAFGELFAQATDAVGAAILDQVGAGFRDEVLWCLTTAYGGLGYAGIEPKAFPAMLACYATSSRGRGDHTHAWTVQAEESGLAGAETIAAVVAASQWNKALVDSLGICDFLPGDVASEVFLDLYCAITGNRYTADAFIECGKRIVSLEREINGVQGRDRSYDAYLPPKFLAPMSCGPMKGRKADPDYLSRILDAYYAQHGWNDLGKVEGNSMFLGHPATSGDGHKAELVLSTNRNHEIAVGGSAP
jgi:aldehyde:ferredoxin oxidoreductase